MMLNSSRLTAPGKLILVGEYAVLHGSKAVSMAVDRRAVLRWDPASNGAGEDLVSVTRRFCAQGLSFDLPAGSCVVDSSCFQHEGVKMGLGSSAAVAVLAAASVFFEAGYLSSGDFSNEGARMALWRAAKQAHDDFQGAVGSGVDLATSVFGGILAFEPGTGRSTPWALPEQASLVFLWTGRPASTGSMLRSIAEVEKKQPGELKDLLRAMGTISDELAGQAAPSCSTLISALDEYGGLMDRLGGLCSLPIVDDPCRRLRALAVDLGGAVKPSGAGGGDFVLGVFSDSERARRFADLAKTRGAQPMDLRVGAPGVHLDSGHENEKRI